MLYHDIRGAMKYGIRRTFAPVQLRHLTLANADISKSSPYEAVNYYMLEKLLNAFRSQSACTSIVDLGCGKGRVMVTSAYFGFTSITGIDFAKELCEEAAFNMQKVQSVFPRTNWRVIHANVLDYLIQPDDAVFFMFNPFAEETLTSFLTRLEESCKLFPRKIYFLYASPQYQQLLLDNGYAIIYQKQMMHLESIIAVRD